MWDYSVLFEHPIKKNECGIMDTDVTDVVEVV